MPLRRRFDRPDVSHGAAITIAIDLARLAALIGCRAAAVRSCVNRGAAELERCVLVAPVEFKR